MTDTKQMKKDLQIMAKRLRTKKSTWCQCCMSKKQIEKNTCTLNFYKKKTDDEMKDIVLSDDVSEFRRKYMEVKTSIETNSLNQTIMRFSW